MTEEPDTALTNPALQGPVPTGYAAAGQNALEAITRGEVDQQVATAKKYPRSIGAFRQDALSMATVNAEVAAQCFYVLKRRKREGGEATITGPSIRFAEILAAAWGNLRWGSREVLRTDKTLSAQGVCWDLEKNTVLSTDVTRSVKDRNNRTFSPDMMEMTSLGTCARARRNAIIATVPRALWEDILAEAQKVAVGDAKTLEARRDEALAYFGKMGITPDRILAALSVESVADIGLDLLGQLKGMATALKDGDLTVDDAFPALRGATPDDGQTRTQRLAAEVKAKATPREPGEE